MSDMIWNGSYTLGNSQETQITAGTGIKVTTPAAGQIQISNDETVLYTGTRTFSLITSESIFNFEYIDVYQNSAGTLQCPAQRIDTSKISTEFRIGCSYNYNTTTMYYFGSIWTIGSDGKTLSAPDKGSGFSLNLSNGTIAPYTNNGSNGCIMKIVGINRIAGGN